MIKSVQQKEGTSPPAGPHDDLIGRLLAEVAFIKGDASAWGVDTYGDMPRTLTLLSEAATALQSLQAANAALKAKLAVAVEALERFADFGAAVLAEAPGDADNACFEGVSGTYVVPLKDFRRAREALATIGGGK